MKWFERAEKLRIERGLSKADIARKMGADEPTVNRWLHGNRGSDSISTLEKVARALDVHPLVLLFGDDNEIATLVTFTSMTPQERKLLLTWVKLAKQIPIE